MKNWSLARKKSFLWQRARIIKSLREFFISKGYLEVETPHRIPAPAPESHIDPFSSEGWYLHPSPELCMKRILSAGYEKIFQICRCWRKGERGGRHLPEFTMLEWYRAGVDYFGLMEECEELIQTLKEELILGEAITYQGKKIFLEPPCERITVEEAFSHYGGISANEALRLDLFDELMVKKIEPHLGIYKPTFIYDYPSERRSLARLKKGAPSLAERFELYIGGLEIANGFSELTDPEEQRKVFQSEIENRQSLGKEIHPFPEKFLEELESLLPSAGIALGVDRLVMVLLDAERIDEVVSFTPEEL
ncbi:MAG: EF-P lysine aminoacylase EpmA [Thermodesulfobacteriota bacterium]